MNTKQTGFMNKVSARAGLF